MGRAALVLYAGAILGMGCQGDRPVESGEAPSLGVTRITDGFRLVNTSDEPLAYIVWNHGWLGLFAPCVDPTPDCLRLAAGAAVEVADRDVVGYADGMREVVVRWWRVIPDEGGGYRAGEVSEVVIEL